MQKEPELSVNIRAEGLRILIVGGGHVALQKLQALPTGVRVRLVAPKILKGLRRPHLEILERPYRLSDLKGAEIIFAATDDPDLNESIADAALALGLWVSVADQPRLGNFTLPAVSEHGLIKFSVSSSGASPAVSKALRQWLDARLRGSKLLKLTEALGRERAALKADPKRKAKLLKKVQDPRRFSKLLNA